MKKVLLLLAVCFCLYSPVGSAELYQNRDYNFQLDIPDGWVDLTSDSKDKINPSGEFIIIRGIKREQEGKWYGAVFKLTVQNEKSFLNGATFSDLTPKQEKELLKECLQAVKDRYPTSYITYSDFIKLGYNKVCIIKAGFTDSPAKSEWIFWVMKRTDYRSELIFNDDDKDIYEQQFMEMLKTLKPIY